VDKDGNGITNDEYVRIWKKSVLAHPTVLHLPVKNKEICTINGPERRHCSHESVPCSVYPNVYHIYVAYSEINVRWASVGSPVKMATWHWHSTER
jgi:hypothetical protein